VSHSRSTSADIHRNKDTKQWWFDISKISIYRFRYRYIVSYCRKNIEFFDISRYLLCITIFSIYYNILRQKFIFLLLQYQNNENKWRKWQTNQSKLTTVSYLNDTTVYSSFLSSLTHLGIYVNQTALLNVHVLFLWLYKINILTVFKISILILRYFQNIVSISYWNLNPDIESSLAENTASQTDSHRGTHSLTWTPPLSTFYRMNYARKLCLAW